MKDLQDVVNSFNSGNFYQFGHDIGDFIYLVLLSNLPEKNFEDFGPDDLYKLIKGLLEGLRFPNVDVLMNCVNNVPDIYNDIV